MQEDKAQVLTVDRAGWPSGPWDGEPDRIEWKTEAGYPAIMQRVPGHGAWCGYVAVPPGHPLHGKSAGEIDSDVAVHGGVTYADKCHGAVCHVAAENEPADVWWVGFDCVHHCDLAPGHEKRVAALHLGVNAVFATRWALQYRDVAYVRAECEALARQLQAAAQQTEERHGV